ncbi:MAG: peptidyl-prolyl cis-trans isomerase [Candidatus Eisenbacteria bacterium]|nr:peptidyl-prolyl cis-trans isomerase [Candidatus Eisenbacteria bacterium]
MRSSVSTRGLILGALIMAGLAGCAQDPPDTVASMRGWRLSQAQLKTEWERLHPGASYDTTSAQTRTELANTLLDKETLLKMAREACPKPDLQRARSLRLTYEKMLNRDFQQYRRENFALSDDGLEERLKKISRSARVRICSLSGRAGAAQAAAMMQQGESFESIATKIGKKINLGTEPGWEEQELRVGKSPIILLAATMLEGVPAGATSRPVEAPQGIYLIKVLEYQPFDIGSEPGLLDRAKSLLNDLAFMPHNVAYVDSLKKASGIKLHVGADSLIAVRMAAFWDSINAAGIEGKEVNYQTLRGPVWRFSKEEQARPCYDFHGTTHTVGEFMRSLDDVDLDSWPTVGVLAKLTFQIENRVQRMMFNAEAEKAGIQNRPIFVERLRRAEENGLLDQFRETALLPKSTPSEEEMRAYFEKHASAYRTPDLASFGMIIFPPDKEARAAQVAEKLRAGDPLLWYELGPAEQLLDPRIQLFSDSKELNLNDPPPEPSWQPFLDAAKPLDTGQIAGPLRTQHGFSLLRVASRARPMQSTYEQARPLLEPAVRDSKANELVEQMLTQNRKKWGAKIYPERLKG